MNHARLTDMPFFKSPSKKELEPVARQADEVDVQAGKVSAKQCDLGHTFFVIESGAAEVTRDGGHVADLGPGDFFGDIAMLEADRRNATVTATAPTERIVMTRASFRSIDKAMPDLHRTLQQTIEQRRTATT